MNIYKKDTLSYVLTNVQNQNYFTENLIICMNTLKENYKHYK